MATIVLVVGNKASLTADDTPLQDRLVNTHGHSVVLRSDEEAEYGSAYDGVVISDSCAAATLGTKYSTVAKPAITADSGEWTGAWGFATTSAQHGGVTQWTVPTASDVTDGLSGTITVYSSSTTQNGVNPSGIAGGATAQATVTGQSTNAPFVTIEAGGALAGGGTAPARRAIFGLRSGSTALLTADGYRLLDGVIRWAFGPAFTTHAGAAAVAGAGAVTASATRTSAAQAAAAATAAVSATGIATRPASAGVSGQAVTIANGQRVHPAQAVVAGQAAALAQSGLAAAATVAGQAATLAGARQTHTGQAAVAGQGSISAAGRQTFASAAAVAGAGVVGADGRRVHPAQAGVSGLGATSADGRRVHPVQAAVAAQFSTLFTPTLTQIVSAAVTGQGRVVAAARIDKPGLNVSLWAVTGSGVLAPLPALRRMELSRERNGVGAIRVDYPAAATGFSYLHAAVSGDKPVEVEMWLGGKQEGRLRGLLTQATGDDLDRRSVWSFAGTFLDAILADGVVYPQPEPAEKGELRFDAKNAGEVIWTVLQQAQARGVLTGVTRDWTTSLDSSGQAWPNTISGLTYSPKTSLLAILQDLVEKDFCEFELTADRVLRLWAPDRRGTDRTSGADPTLFRWGRVSASPLRHSTREVATAVLAIGKDGLSATASDASAQARIGRRVEVGVDAGNIADQGALTAYAQAALAAMTKGQEEIRHPLTFAPGDPRPRAGYDLADRVLSERAGGVRRAVDVQQWTLTVDRQGSTGEVVLNDLIQSRLQRLARQVERIGSGSAIIGTSDPAADDTLAPAAPTGLTLSSQAYQDGPDTYATVTASWAPVTTNSDGSGTDDVAGYRVQWRSAGAGTSGGWIQAADTSGTSATFGGVAAGIDVSVRVAAYDRVGNVSAWSNASVITTATDTTAPPTPSTPTVDNYLGVLMVEWDGLGSSGEAMPADFDYVEVHMSAAAVFTPNATTYYDRLFGAGVMPVPDQPYGVNRYFRLVALDRTTPTPNRSAASGTGSGAASQVVSADVFDGAIGSAKLADLAVTTAKINDLAVNNAKIGDLSVGKLTAGTFSAALTLSGIFRTGVSPNARGEWDSTSFRQYNASNQQTLAFVPGGVSFMTGEFRTALSGQRLVFNPGGSVPDEVRIFPSAGGDFGRIMARTSPADGSAATLIDGGAATGTGRGRLGAYKGEAFVSYVTNDSGGDTSAGFSRTAVSCNANSILNWTQNIIEFSKYSGGSKINMSNMYMIWKDGTSGDHCPVLTANIVNAGIKFDSGYVCAVINEGTLFGGIKATEFVVTSSEESKTDIVDARTVLAPLLANRAARAKAWRYTDEVAELGDAAPIRLGPLAEELPSQLVRMTPRADGAGLERSVDVSSMAGALWAMFNQLQDQEPRNVQGRAVITEGQILATPRRQVTIQWDEQPMEIPTDIVATAIASMPTAAGRLRARVLPGSVTLNGCTVEIVPDTGLIPIVVTAALPVSVEVTGRYTYLPPLEIPV